MSNSLPKIAKYRLDYYTMMTVSTWFGLSSKRVRNYKYVRANSLSKILKKRNELIKKGHYPILRIKERGEYYRTHTHD